MSDGRHRSRHDGVMFRPATILDPDGAKQKSRATLTLEQTLSEVPACQRQEAGGYVVEHNAGAMGQAF